MSGFSPYLPDDFLEFWGQTSEAAKNAPLDFKRSLHPTFDLDGFQIESLSFRGIDGQTCCGWIAYPDGARRLPSFLWIPPYGRESLLPNPYGTRQGMASLSFNLHGLPEYHQEKYTPARGYFAEGAEDPETWVFRKIWQNCLVAARVLQAQIEVDEDRIGAMGMSQGAGLSIWLGAFCPIIKAVCADMPFLSAIRFALESQVYRYPLKELADAMDEIPLGRERILNTVAYFDTMNVATQCRVPTQVSLGLRDPAAKPDNVTAAFEALAGEKRLIKYDWGHDWHPEMIENNADWLREHMP